MQRLHCISHQCLLWGDQRLGEGRHLPDADIKALARVHELAHSKRATTIADLFGEPENEE